MLHAGTLGLIFEPIATAIEAVVERIADSALVMLDLNCRPSAITDPEGYRARLDRLLRRCHVVKASDADLEYLDPGRSDVDAARALLERGPAVVLLTRGARGATVLSADGETEVAAPRIEVADTIGAGDAFGGGFLAWWRREGLGAADLERADAVVEATRFACLVAARTCERPGASPPRLAELERATVIHVPVRPVFTCEYCGIRPDEETFAALQRQMLDLRFGEYVDADPGRWLTWHGRGIYGRTRYACG